MLLIIRQSEPALYSLFIKKISTSEPVFKKMSILEPTLPLNQARNVSLTIVANRSYMYSSQLLSSLQALEETQLQRFEVFIESPYFNKDDRVKRLLAAIMPYAPDFALSQPEAPAIFARMFPGEPFDEAKLEKVEDQLHQLLKRFISELENDQRTFLIDALLLSQLRKQQISEVFQDWDQEASPASPQHLAPRPVADALLVARKLRRTCEQLSSNYPTDPKTFQPLADSLNTFLAYQPQDFWELPTVQLYYQIFLMLTEPQHEAHLTHFIELVDTLHERFSTAEIYAAFRHPIRFCKQGIATGHPSAQIQLFLLYKMLVDRNWIVIDAAIDPQMYREVVATGLQVGQFAWTKGFIHRFRPHLPPESRKDIFMLSLAHYYDQADQYPKAKELLLSTRFSSLSYELEGRYLLLQLLWQHEEQETLSLQIEIFRSFLELNHDLDSEIRSQNLALLGLLTRLSRLRSRADYMLTGTLQAEIQRYAQDLEQQAEQPYLDWLKAQFETIQLRYATEPR